MKAISFMLILSATILDSCDPPYHSVAFPETPVNVDGINSEFDDYNSTSPLVGETTPLCFSSNRKSGGKDFDIVYKLLDITASKSNGITTVEENTTASADVYVANINLSWAMSVVNTGYDQLGPYLIPQGNSNMKVGNAYQPFQHYILLYATNESGNLDIKFTHNLSGDNYSAPREIDFLNSEKDDAYPTLTSDSSAIYFCSNREGNFDIYNAALINGGDLLTALSDSTVRPIAKDVSLSSGADDKCPFIAGNLMVFVSNRPGGYGGFDLYYSTFNEGKWSEPVNFGDKINSPFDEYRPIVKVYEIGFTNDFMLFSSNRPGGKGGFDLYYVGIDKMTE
jgi:hypothetical protein